jgi:drug/metabolite transporter (DMT)-like permease
MSWQVWIFISIVFYSVAVLWQRSLLREEGSDPRAYSVFFMLCSGLIIGAFGLLTGAMSFPNLRPVAPNLALMTLFYGVGSVMMFQALKLTEASRFTIIFAARVLFTILASSILLREGLTAKQFGGTLLILAGVVLVSLQSRRLRFGKGDILALLTAILFGLENTNDRYLLQIVAFYPLMFLTFVLPALLVILLNPGVVRRFKLFFRRRLLLSITSFSLVYAVAAVAFFAAFKTSDNSSQVVSVNLTSVILTVLLAVVFLGERDDLSKKLAAAFLSFVGLRLLT